MQLQWGQTNEAFANLKTELIKPCNALKGKEKMRFTMRAVVIVRSLNNSGLPRPACLGCFHSVIYSSSIQNVSEPRVISELLYLRQLVVYSEASA